MVKNVKDELVANECDKLLTKLINDERNYNDLIPENYVVKDYFKNVILNNKNILLYYEEKAKVVGYVFFKYIENEDGKGYIIDGLYVEENYRNKGVAKLLIKSGLEAVKSSKNDFIDINVMYNNKIAIKLYESFGFEIFRLSMRKR